MFELISLSVIGVAGWFWADANRAREIARAAGRARCQQAQVQFLDDSVACEWQGLQRNGHGRLVWARQFVFEFTRSGSHRFRGRVHVLGRVVEGVEFDAAFENENEGA